MFGTLQSKATLWNFTDPVFYLDNGVLGGTMTYRGNDKWAMCDLHGLLSECGIDAKELIGYFSIERND